MLKPPALAAGDTLAAVTLSWGGPGAIPARYEVGVRQLEQALDVRVVPTAHALADPEWIARHPEARAADLEAAFADPAIRGIVSTIGGEDSVRILPHLDLELLRAHPKVLLGFSDTTATHFACQRAGLVSFYGPSIMAGFAENCGIFPYELESVRRTLFRAEPIGELAPHAGGWTAENLDWNEPANQARPRELQPHAPRRWDAPRGGTHGGPLVGGCLEVLEFLKGTPWWPEPARWDGAVLFLETSEEAPAPPQVQRWLRNYGSQGILQRLSGLLLGRPGGGVTAEAFEAYDAAVLAVVRDELGLSLPVVTRLDFGHTSPMATLPLGVRIELDCDARRLEIPEAAVTPR